MNDKLIDRAKRFACVAHSKQRRKFGQRLYIYHPAQVVKLIKWYGYNDENLISAGWLHDVYEDCGIDLNTLEREFNYEIRKLVWEVSHPLTPVNWNRERRWRFYLDHYIAASPYGRVLKLCDRLANIQEYIKYYHLLQKREIDFILFVYLNESNELWKYVKTSNEVLATDLLYNIIKLERILL